MAAAVRGHKYPGVFCIFHFVYIANIYACCCEGGRVYEISKQWKGREITPSKLQNTKDPKNLIHFSTDAHFNNQGSRKLKKKSCDAQFII